MRVELRKGLGGGPSMTVNVDAVPRKGETIVFDRTAELDPNDNDFLKEFYGDEDDWYPELIVEDVVYYTSGGCPVILLKK
jgi:hypothetical protein